MEKGLHSFRRLKQQKQQRCHSFTDDLLVEIANEFGTELFFKSSSPSTPCPMK